MPVPVLIGGIPCAVESQSETWGENGPEATITFKVPYAYRYVVANALKGTATLDPSGAVVRTPPFRYPRGTNLHCTSIGQIEGRGNPRQTAADGMFDYDWAFMTANFGVLRYQFDAGDPAAGHRDPSGLPYTTTRVRTNAELFTPPGKNYFTVYDGKPVPESAVAIIRPHAEFAMTRVLMPYIPTAESMMFLQSVNSGPIRIGNRTFPRGTLMYGGMEPDDGGDPLGRLVWSVTYSILANYEVEWNEIFKEKDWRIINTESDGTGDYPFPYVNFDNPTLSQLLSGFPA